jgi:threonine synthase
LRDLFSAVPIGEHETETTIRGLFDESGILVDPHTAVGIAASRAEGDTGRTPMIVLSTAHAAKFPDVVERATGRAPEQPGRLKLKLGQHERCASLPNDYNEVAAFIAAHARPRDGFARGHNRPTEVIA